MPAAGVPLRTPVAALKLTPLGKVPVSLSVGAGEPVAVTVKVPLLPAVNVCCSASVKAGVCVTVSVNVWVKYRRVGGGEGIVVGAGGICGGVPLRTPVPA